MRVIKISLLILILVMTLGTFEKKAEAHTRLSFGFSNYPGFYHSYYPYWYGFGWPYYYGYGYSPFYYRPYYRPYGYGYGYGYNYYGYGEIRIEVKPKTSKVYVDGAYTGTVDDYDGWWQRLKLEPGTHRIVIRQGGFAPYAETVRVLPGQDYHIKVQMQPGEDRISQSDMMPERRDDRYDNRRYNDRNDHYGYRPRQDNDNNERDRERYRNEDRDRDRYNNEDRDRDRDRDNNYRSDNEGMQDRNKQTFVLQVDPHDATVYIDGNYYGTADVNENGEVQVLLPKGVHKVEVVRPGFESFSQDITIDGKDDNRLVVQLHKK